MKQATWLFAFCVCLGTRKLSANAEDCLSVKPKDLPHMSERVVGYTLTANEKPICDNWIDEGWYNLTTSYVITRSTKPCGTSYNWYLKDDLPTYDKNPKNLTVCRYDDDKNICGDTKTIKGLKCTSGYLFYLKTLDSCPEAYCIENTDPNAVREKAPNITHINPVVNAQVVNGQSSKEVEFHCDINTTPREKYLWTVEWSLHTGLALASSLKQHKPVEYKSDDDFRRQTALTEDHLKLHAIYKPGFTLSCSVTAQIGINGYKSHAQLSLPKYFGLQIVNNTDSKLQVTNDSKAILKLKLTIPFGCARPGCFLEFKVSIPKKLPDKNSDCTIPQLSHMAHEDSRCGVIFEQKDVLEGNTKEFTVTAKYGTSQSMTFNMVYDVALITNSINNNHAFFRSYMGASVRVEVGVSQDILQNKVCSSTSDPHMATFDGTLYNNHNQGTYIMYRHKTLQMEVQTKLTQCWNYNDSSARPLCNCGVAVRAGKDIFMIDKCGQVTRPASLALCNDGVFARKIHISGDETKIFLPSGGVVVLKDIYGFINVYIYPSLADFKQTEGLCGSFDNDKGNDDKLSDGVEIARWRVLSTSGEYLFNTQNYQSLSHWREERLLCQCDLENSNGVFNPTAVCDTTKAILCPDDHNNPIESDTLCAINVDSRRRRDVILSSKVHMSSETNILPEYKFDSYSNPETAFFKIHKHQKSNENNKIHGLVKRSVNVYNNASALQECRHMMNTTVFQMCSTVPDLDFDNFINDCVADAVASGSMDWTMTHLESIKKKCIHHVNVMQPIPSDILAEITHDPFDNSTTTNSTNNTIASTPSTTSRPVIGIITPELLSNLKAISCPNECNGNGVCKNGTCLCNDPFISFDCSINKTKPPEMIGIPDKGVCDLSVRACEKTAVIGKRFADASSLKCSLIPFQIDRHTNISYQETIVTNGSFESLDEVYCRLPQPQVRSKRSAGALSDEYVSRGYHVSVSNDGSEFSDSDSIVIFDSTCVNCHKELDKIICSTNPNYCLNNGRCYTIGETEGCYSCLDTTPNHVGWVAGPDCAQQVIPEEEKKLWIIGAVLGPFAIFAVGLTVVLCYLVKRKQLTRAKVGSLTEIKDK